MQEKLNALSLSLGLDEIPIEEEYEISYCKSCHCMTKTIKGKCGKCKEGK